MSEESTSENPNDDEIDDPEISVMMRTRLDDNFDEMRRLLTANGVTLEMALDKLREMREN